MVSVMNRTSRHQPCSLEKQATALIRDEPALISSLDFGPFVRQGTGKGPKLLIGDPSEIPLSSATASHLEYRMALLAQPGDHVVVRQRHQDFETYLSTFLGLRDVTFHEVQTDNPVPVARQAWASQAWIKTFSDVSKASRGLTVQSYLTTGNTWRLAQAIGERSDQIVHVSGPSPRISRRANDKLWYAERVKSIIGAGATPPTLSAFGPAATAGLVHRISKVAGQVIVKVPDSAGSSGNLRLDSAAVRDKSLANLRQFLLDRLHSMGWHDNYPVLVGVWDKNVICSPSAQLWLPLRSEGAPRVEGIFEQRVQTYAATFVGAARSTLPQKVQDRLSAQAMRIARLLQRLGYYGRCSLDAVLCRNGNGPPVIHWIECNGRWGGVSIPMTAACQLTGRQCAPALAILQDHLPNRDLKINGLLQRLKGLLLSREDPLQGLVILSPPDHPNGALVNLLAIGKIQAEADDMLRLAVDRLSAPHRS